MADLTELDRAAAVKIAGANPSTGIADNFMEVDASGRLTIKLNDASGSAINLGQSTMAGSIPIVIASNQSAFPVSQSGTWTTGRTWTLASGTDSIASVQSGTWNITNISGTISLPTGAATETTLSALNTKVTTTVNGIKIDGSAVTQPVSGTFWQATQPVSAASLPLPTGAATSSLQTTSNSSLSSIDSKTPALGQALAAASVPVVLTAAQLTTLTPLSTVAVTQSTSPWSIAGNIASGQADTGNPIKVGGVYNSTLPVVSSGQRVDLQLDASGRLLTSTSVTTSLPAATFSNQRVITNGSTVYTVFTATQKLAIKQFYAGGTGIGKQALFSYAASNTLLLNSGDFETAGDITNWPYFSNGGSGTGTVALSTAHAFTGTHSAAVTFTTSDANHSNGLKQTFGTPLDISDWRYITAEFFNTVSVGAAYTRTISIVIIDSNANTRKFDLSGLSTASPFNASNWVKITGEIANPTSSTGSTFDVTSVVSIELRMVDSATRAGTVYWDTAQLEAQLTPIFPIYHYQNTSFNIAIDPVFIMNIGDQILITQTNNDTSKQEYFALAGGVATT